MAAIEDRLSDQSGNDPAATCFFNALLRESGHWEWDASGQRIAVPVDAGTLLVEVSHRSASGECRFRWPPMLDRGDGVMAVDFEVALDRVLATPSLTGDADPDSKARVRERVLNSRNNIEASRTARGDLAWLQASPLNFHEAEQGLLIGHPFHPAPKSRSPFGPDEARAYCPEHAAQFSLAWWAVHPDWLAAASSRAATASELAADLLPASLHHRCPSGYTPLPMHPWQAEQLRQASHIQALEQSGALVWLGHDTPHWLPTASHRSLYAPGQPWMVKGSLAARLTNSLRLLSVKEVDRGLLMDRSTDNAELAERFPGFGVMQEPAWLGWYQPDGSVDAASLAVLRENPLQQAPDTEAVMLATLTQQPGKPTKPACWRRASTMLPNAMPARQTPRRTPGSRPFARPY